MRLSAGACLGSCLGTGSICASFSGGKRQLDAKCRSPANLRRKVYRTVVELYNSEGAGQSDAAAARTRGKEQWKNFLPVLQWDPFAGAAHGEFCHFSDTAEH